MASVLERVPQSGCVLVIRLRSLGDCVLSTPAIALLKHHRPDLRVTVVVEDRFRAIFEGNPDIESLLPPEAAAVRSCRPHLALNLHGGSRSSILTAASGATWRAGFTNFRNSFVYNVKIPTAQEIFHVHRTVHTCEHLASAVFYLGVPMVEIPRASLFADSVSGPVQEPYTVLHPAASQPDKTWPAERFLAVARHLRDHFGLNPVFIGAETDALSPFAAYRTLAGAPLSEIKSLLARATLFVGNDSGPAHMAAAFGVPVVVVFGSSDPVIWAPWRTSGEVLTHQDGITSISVQDALGALGRMRVHV
jgi:ADP-heptose:LPS heptosyltransferase